MLEDIKDAIEKRRDLEVKDMQGATAVGFQYGSIKSCDVYFPATSKRLCMIYETTPTRNLLLDGFC